jgi:asparagine synthase (glutamine-hydrolysing)
MSAICGLVHRDRSPIGVESFEKQMKALAHFGPDGSEMWIEAEVGLGHQSMFITPESRYEKLPLAFNNLIVTADTRLDNRAELLRWLKIPDETLDDIPDSQLILLAYQKWGVDCPKYLLGDFAFAIWDQRQHSMFCARDPIGIRPFYYHLTANRFIFASDVRGVVAHPDVPTDLCKLALAMHLRDLSFTDPELTFLEHVRKLPPAHILTVSPEGYELRRYWHPQDCPEIRLKNEADYAEMLLDLMQQAVQCRINTAFPVGAHLSGGLDSSTTAVIAARHLRERGQQLFTFNWLHEPEPGDEPCPEFAFSQRVSLQEGIPNHHVQLSVEEVYRQLIQDICLHQAYNFWYESVVQEAAHHQGIRTLLSGWGGDELISSPGRGYYAELFWKLRWRKLINALQSFGIAKFRQHPILSMRGVLSVLYRRVFLPSLPDWLYAQIDREWLAPMWADCAAPELAAFIREHPPLPHRVLRERVGVRSNQIFFLLTGSIAQRIEAWASAGAFQQISYGYPLLDLRLVAFSLGIPPSLFVKGKYGRYLFRQAIEGILPDEIRWGSTKLEPRRVARYQELTDQAASKWLKQLRSDQKLRTSGPFIDIQALNNFAMNGQKGGDAKFTTTLVHSIQALNAGSELGYRQSSQRT